MGMRAGLLLFLLLLSLCCPAQLTRKKGDDVARFRRRMAELAPVQRIKSTIVYCRQLSAQSRFAEARPLLHEILATTRQASLWSWAGESCFQLGQLESSAGNNTLSIDYYLQGLAIFRMIHAYDLEQLTCYNISDEYNTLQNSAKSGEYRQQANQLANVHRTTTFPVQAL